MFDIGWTELVVVACVAVLVVGPKDLPRMLRAFGKTVSQLRRMAGDFQKQFDEALKEAELDEVKNIASGKNFQPLEDARKSMQSFQKSVSDSVREVEADVKSGMDEPAATSTTKTNGSQPPAESSAAPEPVAMEAAKPATTAKKAKPAATKTRANGKAAAKPAAKSSAKPAAKSTAKPAAAKKTAAASKSSGSSAAKSPRTSSKQAKAGASSGKS